MPFRATKIKLHRVRQQKKQTVMLIKQVLAWVTRNLFPNQWRLRLLKKVATGRDNNSRKKIGRRSETRSRAITFSSTINQVTLIRRHYLPQSMRRCGIQARDLIHSKSKKKEKTTWIWRRLSRVPAFRWQLQTLIYSNSYPGLSLILDDSPNHLITKEVLPSQCKKWKLITWCLELRRMTTIHGIARRSIGSSPKLIFD